MLTYGIPPEFRGGVHLFILNRHTYAIGSVPSLSGLMAFTAQRPPA